MPIDQTQLHDWLQLIRAEYEEIPGLQLTQAQAQRLWNLDALMAEALLGELVSAGVLKKASNDTYTRADSR